MNSNLRSTFLVIGKDLDKIDFNFFMSQIRWGIIGPGSIANNFADALKESYSGELIAIASLNDNRRNEFGDKYNIKKNLDLMFMMIIIKFKDIDAIYISTPHTLTC